MRRDNVARVPGLADHQSRWPTRLPQCSRLPWDLKTPRAVENARGKVAVRMGFAPMTFPQTTGCSD